MNEVLEVSKVSENLYTLKDNKLIRICNDLQKLEDMQREINKTRRALNEKMNDRLAELGSLGPLYEYPTERQVIALRLYSYALSIGMPDVIKVGYEAAIELGCQNTSWRDDGGRNIVASYQYYVHGEGQSVVSSNAIAYQIAKENGEEMNEQ